MRNAIRAAGAALAAVLSLAAAAATAQPAAPAPKLVVVVVVDQFAANLMNQHRAGFTGGLKTLLDEGLVYANGYHTHGLTETCPGHSTVLSGMHPSHTGIPANDWRDPASGRTVYCLAAPQNTLAHPGERDNGPVGPDQLRADNLSDWLKAQRPRSRVFAVSGKDRGAITLAGRRPDGAFWFSEGAGFTTYVRPGESAAAKLRPVAALNARILARLQAEPPSWTYTDDRCRRLAADWPIGDAVLHSALPSDSFAFDTSPLLDEATAEAGIALLQEQRLGRGPAVDLLGVSFSATDRIGHRYGSQGPEMCEQMRRLDAALGRLLEQVRAVPGGALLVLTADHGGSDFAERLAARGYPEARRADPQLLARLNAALRARFPLAADPLRIDGTGLYVVGADGAALPEPQRHEVAEAAAALLRADPAVAGAWTLPQLLATPAPPPSLGPQELTLQQRLALSAVAGRSPDVMFAFQPGISPGRPRVGAVVAGHGSPWDYDRRVPIIFWRPGAEGQERTLPIRTVDIGPTLAAAIGVRAPAGLDGRCLELGYAAGPVC